MLQSGERAQLIAAARLYYEDNLTQAQVAQKLGISRPSVSKMLTKAREVGIVRIEICAGAEGDADLLEQLQLRYGLLGGCVLPADKNLWQQIARYLVAETSYDSNLGLGWGYVLGEICSVLGTFPIQPQNGSIYPLVGTAHFPHRGYHPDDLVKTWAEATGRSCIPLNCPAFPDSAEDRDRLESTASFSKLQSLWQQLDAAIVHLKGFPSVPDQATATRFGDALKQQKAVGSFLSYYYNERGEFISGNNDFCIHVPLAQLRHCRKIIAIGTNTTDKAILGALATGLITNLIVNEEQARRLL